MTEILQRVKNCTPNHTACEAFSKLTGPTQIPSYPTGPQRISCLGDGNYHVCVVSGQGLSSGECYITLSHCWGRSQHLQLLKSNYRQFSETISTSDLPKTFLDAMIVAKELGISYL